jgi:hypothetical protein
VTAEKTRKRADPEATSGEPPLQSTPLALEAESVGGMLNFEIHDHPMYSGLEIQVFDDEEHGTGKLIFLSRTDDGTTDVYLEPGLRLDPAGYAIGGGLGLWKETIFDPDRVVLAPNCLDVDIGLVDRADRSIRIRAVDEKSSRERRTAPFLAPMGAAIQSPNRLPLVWMGRFDLLRRRSRFEVTIDDDPIEIGRLPGAALHRRRLVKYASDLFVVSVNPSYEGQLEEVIIDDVANDSEGHRAYLQVDRGIALDGLPSGEETSGTWRLWIDGTDLVRGRWSAYRVDFVVTLGMEVDRGWHPKGLPPFMNLVTTVVPVFRRWPTTYRWWAEIDLDRRWMTSRWERTPDGDDRAYRDVTSPG